ncbi:MAG: S9 family peptidase [Pedobacter sp.]|nr:MAG: S9 family peptidase [Pedobacter sp.]
MQKRLTFLFLACATFAYAQKKPLDHSVYDTWESVGSKQFSKDGNWAAYSINQQEGDANLYFQHSANSQKLKISRGVATSGFGGSGSLFSPDSKFAAFAIKPWQKDSRMAKIKKKKPDELTKDTLGIVNLTTLAVTKIPRVKSFKFPENGLALLAYNLEKPLDTTKKRPTPTPSTELKNDDFQLLIADDEPFSAAKEGTDLVLKNLTTGVERVFKYVNDYSFSKDGKQMIFTSSGSKKDKTVQQGVFLLNTTTGVVKTLVKGKGNFKGFIFDEDSEHIAFLGETSPEKAEIKDFNVYYSSLTLDSAQILVDKDIDGMPEKFAVSGDGRLNFSKDGAKLFFGIAPIKKPKDTTLIDFENAKLDIWGYKDDYLQPMQIRNADRESKRTYMTVIDVYGEAKIVPLTDYKLPEATLVNEGNAAFLLGSTDYGNRIPSQWTGGSVRDYYLIDVKTAARKKVLESFSGNVSASPEGNYLIYYDKKSMLWNTYQVATGKTTALNTGMQVKFFNEENDVPDDPNSYGLAGWTEGDKAVLLYDRYDIWQFAPDGKSAPKNLTNGIGRTNNLTFRVERLDPDSRSFGKKDVLLLDAVNNTTKENGFYRKAINDNKNPELIVMADTKFSPVVKAKNAEIYLFDKGNYSTSPEIFISKDLKTATKIASTNPQQSNYNWGTAELVKWTTPKGFKSEGVLYKPEDFDPNKKYPMIVYFYEKLSDGLYSYKAPAPSASSINIPYFVSNGYLVFTPDISYETGHPGKSAEEFINSGVEALKKNAWVDGTKIGIQGQSWGGYQVAHLITATNMYAAAWAGAPVSNMTSAYGGIRWDSGMNRQFQYEKTQSRIGATLWEKPELYIENSPLFHLPKVNTPVVIMSNDADGAVPWYQGIEMFTGLKRLGKPVWLLNYNNEAHNLVQRQNRKDIQIRLGQFFDYYLKGAKAPVWLASGIPATEKGKTWGFELTDEKP